MNLKRKILILRLDELGDFILWLDCAKEFKRIYPNDQITLMFNVKWLDLVKTLPYWDEYIGINPKRFRLDPVYRMSIKWALDKLKYDIVISPRCSPRPFLEDSIIKMSGAKEIYKYESLPEQHELINNSQFMHTWLPEFQASVPKLNEPLIYRKSFINIFPLSYRKRKQWGIRKYNELKSKLGEVNHSSYILNSHIGLLEFISLIAHSKLVIANDSAPIHLAAALGVPSVAIGSERYGRFLPYPNLPGVLPRLVYKPNVKDITVDEVYTVVREVLDGH